ncbi:MAG: hypothetical protein ACLQPD_04365 [Desulfomonilaceae bacterium]
MTIKRTSKGRINPGYKLFSAMVPDPDAPVISPSQFIKFFREERVEEIERKLFSHKVATLIGGATRPSVGRGKPQMLSFKDAVLMFIAAQINDLLQWPTRTRDCIAVLRPKLDEFIDMISWKKLCDFYDAQPPEPVPVWGFDWSPFLEGRPRFLLIVSGYGKAYFNTVWHEVDSSNPLSFLEIDDVGLPRLVFDATAAFGYYIDSVAYDLIMEKHKPWLPPLR